MTKQEIVEFWQSLCFDVVSKYSESEDWKPWLEKRFIDGTLIHDSNPVYDLINTGRKRAVRIIQESSDVPSDHSHVVWLNKFGEGLSEPSEVIEEMIFTYQFHPVSSQIFSELFDIWVNPRTTFEEMQRIVESK